MTGFLQMNTDNDLVSYGKHGEKIAPNKKWIFFFLTDISCSNNLQKWSIADNTVNLAQPYP